jgi:hypothetical protein
MITETRNAATTIQPPRGDETAPAPNGIPVALRRLVTAAYMKAPFLYLAG